MRYYEEMQFVEEISLWSAGTDVIRRFGDMAAQSDCPKVHDVPSLLRGAYRVILVQKQASSHKDQEASPGGWAASWIPPYGSISPASSDERWMSTLRPSFPC